MRKLAAAAAAALSLIVPAPATADETVVGFNDGERGFVSVTLTPDVAERAGDDLFAVNAECHYLIVDGSASTNRMTVLVWGQAAAGPRATRTHTTPAVPVGTQSTCALRSLSDGEVVTTTRALPGAASSVVQLFEDVEVQQLKVCATAEALFTNGSYLRLHDVCQPPSGLAG